MAAIILHGESSSCMTEGGDERWMREEPRTKWNGLHGYVSFLTLHLVYASLGACVHLIPLKNPC